MFTLRNLLLAGVSGLSLVACGGGSVSSPGSTGNVTVGGGGGGGGGTPTADIDLVPNDNCPAGTTRETITNTTGTVEACTLTGNITENLTLTAENGYALDGPVFVGEDGGANVTLTIPAGTTLFGKAGEDFLVITRGSRINASGTAAAPIIMTSVSDIQNTVNPDTDRAQWGGLILNGFAPINDCIDATATGGSAGCEKSGEGSSGLFGGDNPDDNSGILQYLQVKYAGNLINDEDELNGIGFQGIGRGTTCDHIQVHNNADDGVEFFGGTVECKYMVLTGNADDNIDWTDGFQGKIQYALVIQADDAGDRGIEGDNRSSNNTLTPRSSPTIANMTFLGGPAGDTGVLLRAGTAGRFCNAVVTGFQDAGFDIDDDETFNQAQAGNLTVQSFLLDNKDNVESGDSNETFDTEAFFDAGANNTQANNSLIDGFFPGTVEQGVQACDLSDDTFFDNVDYIGAFSTTETAASNWAAGWTFGVFESPTECPAGTLDSGDTIGGKKICSLTGNITTNVRLNNNFTYQLEGPVFVGEDVGGDGASPKADAKTAILTIDAGTTVFGASGQDLLVINRGSQIRSNGTRTDPVTFTSRDDVFDTADRVNDRAKWGGLILNGRAPINDCIDATASGGDANCEKSGEGSSGLFGGNKADDNSGNLFYTRVFFAGNLINDEDELNGIAFQGVGSGTQVDFIQVHNNEDDGIELFGGRVKLRHLVLTGNADDSLDWTDGWQGRAQFVLVQQASDVGDRGIEADNRSSNNTLLPRSMPIISNFTFVGGASGDTGILVRAGTAGTFRNGVVTGFQDAGIDIDSDESANQANAGALNFNSIYLVDNKDNLEVDGDAGDAALVAAFAAGADNVDGDAQTPPQDSTLTDIFVPGVNELALTATDASTLDPFFVATDYVGAVKDANDDWYKGWTLLVTE